jgi:membrane protease YdiL (CAAX protease family)
MRRLLPDTALFLGGAVLVAAVTKVGVPLVAAAMGIDPFAAWMLLSLVFIFLPVVVGGWALLRSEGHPAPGRLRLQRPSASAWGWAALGAVVIALGSFVLNAQLERLGLAVAPFVRAPRAWDGWMFLVWAVYWPVNILGEEFAWRGVVLPRMERELGGWAWALNGALWGGFHAGFGAGNVLVLVPTLALVPLVAQRTRSTWVAVALHAFTSLPGMALLALGKL